jgi:hypothetical protein
MFNLGCAVFCAVLAYFVVHIWFDPRATQARETLSARPQVDINRNTSANLAQGYKKDLEVLEKELDVQDKALAAERDELTRITDISKTLITVAGVFAFLLGAASWKFLDDQRSAAERALRAQQDLFQSQIVKLLDESNDSLKKVAVLLDEVERDFPMFGRMRNKFDRILFALESSCAQLNDEDDSYNKLDWAQVQDILYYENAMSIAPMLNIGEKSNQMSEIYRLLGAFYGSRFARDKGGEIGDSSREDLDRARFYFGRSIKLNPQSYLAYLYAGYFTQFSDDLEIAAESRDYFGAAARLDTEYQKPMISIALIELEAFNNPKAAISALADAQGRCKYNLRRPLPAIHLITYLRACAQCLIAVKPSTLPDPILLKEALASLSDACEEPSQYVCRNFTSDTNAYFHVLREQPFTSEEFGRIAAKIDSCELQNMPGYN